MTNMIPMLPEAQCEVSQTSITYNAYDIYLDGDIESPSYYRQAFQVLRSAQEGDLVRIYISTNGGDLYSAIMFKNCIEECRGDVVAIVEANCFSAGSLIALSCPSIEIKPYSTMMLHAASFNSSGSVQNIRDHVEFTGRHAEDFMQEVYQDFISEKEMEDLKKGLEIWLDYKQVGERLETMFEMRQLRMEENMESSSSEVSSHRSIDEIIEDAVDSAYQRLLTKFDLVEKLKPVRKAVKKRAPKEVEIEA